MGLAAVHAIADRTDRNPADDPALSARLLEDLGRTMPLEYSDGDTVTTSRPPPRQDRVHARAGDGDTDSPT